jgi:hypothetical protein
MHIRELDQDTWPALKRLFGPNSVDARLDRGGAEDRLSGQHRTGPNLADRLG